MKGKLILLTIFLFVMVNSCAVQPVDDKNNVITEAEVTDSQKEWGKAIVEIGRAYTEKRDYKEAAAKLVARLYGYEKDTVLFKPTKASEVQFRKTKDEALSYFVTGIVRVFRLPVRVSTQTGVFRG